MKGYFILATAIVCEVFGTTMLKLSSGFSKPLFSLLFVIGFGTAFYCLSVSLKYIPLSYAYAVWSGAGTVLTAIIGIIVWHEPFGWLSAAGIILITGGIALLNTSSKQATNQRKAEQY